MEGDPNSLADLFQRMFGGGRRRRREGGRGDGGGQDWGGWQNRVQTAANSGPGWGPSGSSRAGFSVDNNLQWNEPITDHGTLAPPGAPRFADPSGMVRANGYNPMTGFVEDPRLWDPSGMTPSRFQPTVQQLLDQRNWASVPWQGSWADPSASNFYMTAQNLGATPSSYFNPGTWSWGGGQALDNTTGRPGGAQGGQPPPSPPGGNGPTGPAQPAGNFQMYPGMPYAGGMGPYSGWLPPADAALPQSTAAPMTAPSSNYYDINSAVAAGNFPNYGNDAMQYNPNLGMPNSTNYTGVQSNLNPDYTPNVQPNWALAPSFAGGSGPWG